MCELAAQVLKPHAHSIIAGGPPVRLRLPNTARCRGAEPVTARWSVGESFSLRWTEAGGPLISGAPSRTGFGTRLIKQVIVQEIEGEFHADYRRQGLVCRPSVPMENID